MNEAKKDKKPAGIGSGYLSIMMIFVALCLTMLAALSYSTAAGENRYSQKSAEYTKAYYAADLEAKRTLAAVDNIMAQNTLLFDSFEVLQEIENIGGVTGRQAVGYASASWYTPINQSQSIFCEVEYTSSGRKITAWRTVSSSEREEEKQPLDVWLGE